jgi:glycerol-3-phosphate dehydrogenase (NAD(P)+)
MNVTVLGAGSWGMALAKILSEGGHAVTLWGRDARTLAEIRDTARCPRYLPGVELPRQWSLEGDLPRAVAGSECVVVAVPSGSFREVTRPLADYAGIIVSVTKGIEHETGLTMCGVLRENAPRARTCALSGPTFALEVARGIPTAIVGASRDPAAAQTVQALFHRPTFRVYRSDDLLGVELGGALKNIIALAAGVCDGMGFGDNSKAALLTRGIAEIRRLGVACGAESETFSGLSGLGDLTVTCFSKLSRNRGFGERLGRGEKIHAILAGPSVVAEGFPTTRSAHQLARKLQATTPIIDEVHAVLYEGKNAVRAMKDLLGRATKAED